MSQRGNSSLASGNGSTVRFSAAVFDLDGTMVDNMSWHTQAFDAFARRHGLPPMTMEMRKRIDGKRNREIFPLLFERDMTLEEIHAYEQEKEGGYRDISRGQLAPLAGLVRLLDQLDAHRVPVAVATSAPADNVRHTLAEIGLGERIRTIARGDQVKHGKPEPDVFLHAAALLGLPASACVAFEDAPLGVTAAVRAGMRAVALTTTFTREALEASEPAPHAVYRDFDAYLAGEGQWLVTSAPSR